MRPQFRICRYIIRLTMVLMIIGIELPIQAQYPKGKGGITPRSQGYPLENKSSGYDHNGIKPHSIYGFQSGNPQQNQLFLGTERGHGIEVTLSWGANVSIEEIAGFEIQKSENGIDFYGIATVSTLAYKPDLQLYTLTFEESGAGYYQIRQLLYDGREFFTTAEYIPESSTQETWEVFPREVRDYLNIRTRQGYPLPRISLETEKGKFVQVPIQMGNNLQTLRMDELPYGVYLLHLIDPASLEEQTIRILKH